MDKYKYLVIMDRILEIEQEQLNRLYYICKYLDYNIDFNTEYARDRMLQLQEEKNKLIEYVK